MGVAGPVLAAGSGGWLGTPTALVEAGVERFVDRALRVLRNGGCDPTVVVTDAAAVEDDDAATVTNPDWEAGMGSPLRAGPAALADLPDAGAVVVSLVDRPGSRPDGFARLLAAQAGGAAVATCGGQRRNPVRLARETWPEVAARPEGDAGGRPYLKKYAADIAAAPCDDIAAADDIDIAEDLARLRAAREDR